MNAASMFRFEHAAEHFTRQISSHVILHIRRYSNSVARLSFSDDMNAPIPIPAGIALYSKDHATARTTEEIPLRDDAYALCWTEDYAVKWGGDEILAITNKRAWNIEYAHS